MQTFEKWRICTKWDPDTWVCNRRLHFGHFEQLNLKSEFNLWMQNTSFISGEATDSIILKWATNLEQQNCAVNCPQLTAKWGQSHKTANIKHQIKTTASSITNHWHHIVIQAFAFHFWLLIFLIVVYDVLMMFMMDAIQFVHNVDNGLVTGECNGN